MGVPGWLSKIIFNVTIKLNINQGVKTEEIHLLNHVCKAPNIAPTIQHVFKYGKIEMSV